MKSKEPKKFYCTRVTDSRTKEIDVLEGKVGK